MWKKYPKQMKAHLNKKEALLRAIYNAGIDPYSAKAMQLAGPGNMVGFRLRGERKTQFFITMKGLKQISMAYGLKVKL